MPFPTCTTEPVSDPSRFLAIALAALRSEYSPIKEKTAVFKHTVYKPGIYICLKQTSISFHIRPHIAPVFYGILIAVVCSGYHKFWGIFSFKSDPLYAPLLLKAPKGKSSIRLVNW